MILYFSGTGNSEYAAQRIGKAIGDEAVNLFDRIKRNDYAAVYSRRPWIVVVPTYAWRIPRVVQKWAERTEWSGNRKVYFVLTCGDSIGNAEKYLVKLCEKKKMEYCGCMGVVMPENYIALFSTPTQQQAEQIINRAEPVIDRAISYIKSGAAFPKNACSVRDRINSGLINDVFYPLIVHAKQFYVTDRCISCGKCAVVGPLNNIRTESGKPVWGKDCTHCMACISRCPKEAIEYGKHSQGLPRYLCNKKV